jgi:orotidine-5'-phosphate decarboxylase
MRDDRLIVALDFSSMEQVEKTVRQLGDSVGYYKVGMELFFSTGGSVIKFLHNQGKDIFLDVKMHDIPNTVAKAAAVLTRLGVSMINVHASGGAVMMHAAAEAVTQEARFLGIPRPKLIAVTVLTSIGNEEWKNIGSNRPVGEQVVHLARLAQEAGLDGVVSSPQEAASIRTVCGNQFIIVTPGIRPQGSALNDQNRVATPLGALQAGASHLVIGRPITAAVDSRAAAQQILKEMGGFL